MDRRYSPIIDMYGAAPEGHPPRRKSHTWLYVLLTIVAFFAFASIRPVMRLRPDPPPSVVGARQAPAKASQGSQMRMAKACWDFAIVSVQEVYPYGRDLPKNPPPALTRKLGKVSDLSALCWPGLRTAWSQPESWVRSYGWSTDWITSPDGPVQRTIFNILNQFGIRY
jgi:hypothetical protein